MEKIIFIMKEMNSINIEGRGCGWLNLATLGSEMRKSGITVECKLQKYFERMSNIFEIYEDFSRPIKVAYVRLKTNYNSFLNEQNQRTYYDLTDWAYLTDRNDFVKSLSKLALDEPWNFYVCSEASNSLPILWNYIKYTFCRIQHQNKIVYSIDKNYAAFNTGLVDERYLSIIALFKRNAQGYKSEWIFKEFVIAGEGNGKIISSKFSEEIRPATYTDSYSELIYDVELGTPVIDYEHIIINRIERLPMAWLKASILPYVDCKDVFQFKDEHNSYDYELLRKIVKENPIINRSLVNRMKDAVELAIKRVRWNYKNAVPMFYPKRNKMCFLLPLCLVDDSKEDLALVVNKTDANKYEGVTVIPLDWAYTDARVVARPNSEWLDVRNK